MGYTVQGILQARILEWVAFPFSRGSSAPRDQTQVLRIADEILYQLSNKGSPCSFPCLLMVYNNIFSGDQSEETSNSYLHFQKEKEAVFRNGEGESLLACPLTSLIRVLY